MDILFIVPYVPNLIRVRPYNLIRSLTARGHRVTVLTLSNHEEEDVENLKAHCHRVYAHPLPTWRSYYNALTALPTQIPLQAMYSWQPALVNHSIELLNNGNKIPSSNVIHIEHLRGARYGLHLNKHLTQHGLQTPIVWDSVDCIAHLFEQASRLSGKRFSRWLAHFELARTKKYERYLAGQFDRVLVTSQMDQNAFLSMFAEGEQAKNISVLPNGVDLDYFCTNDRLKREEATLVVSGKMSYHANVTMVLQLVKEIMPITWNQRPDVKLIIVGKDPVREIKELAHNPAITVTGTVDDIRPYLQTATLAVAPIPYGAGIQNKVLEAMACATPVVSTSQAISALDVEPGRDLLVADNPDEFAGKILSLLDNQQLRRTIAEAGRKYVMKHHNWDYIAAELENIYLAAIDRKQNGKSGKGGIRSWN